VCFCLILHDCAVFEGWASVRCFHNEQIHTNIEASEATALVLIPVLKPDVHGIFTNNSHLHCLRACVCLFKRKAVKRLSNVGTDQTLESLELILRLVGMTDAVRFI